MNDKAKKLWLFEEIFLLANISINIVLGIFLFTLSKTKNNFRNWKLNSRSYITIEALFTIKRVELIRDKELVSTVFDSDNKISIIYIVSFTIPI